MIIYPPNPFSNHILHFSTQVTKSTSRSPQKWTKWSLEVKSMNPFYAQSQNLNQFITIMNWTSRLENVDTNLGYFKRLGWHPGIELKILLRLAAPAVLVYLINNSCPYSAESSLATSAILSLLLPLLAMWCPILSLWPHGNIYNKMT